MQRPKTHHETLAINLCQLHGEQQLLQLSQLPNPRKCSTVHCLSFHRLAIQVQHFQALKGCYAIHVTRQKFKSGYIQRIHLRTFPENMSAGTHHVCLCMNEHKNSMRLQSTLMWLGALHVL